MVLERLHEPLGRLDLAELALDDAVGGAEAPRAAGTDVHLLDDRAVAPPFRDQLRVGPDGEDVRARRVEDPLDADLELVRRGDGGGVHARSFRAFDDLREAVEPLQPRADALEGGGRERAPAGPADLLRRHELRLLEQPDVLLHPGQRHAERLGELADRRAARAEPFEDGAAGRVGEGCERAVDGRRILNH